MSPALRIEQIEEWRDQLRHELQELERQATPLLAHIRQLKQQLDLLDRLARVTAEGALPDPPASPSELTAPNDQGSPPTEIIAEILRKAGEPLHISAIRERYIASGHLIPGKGTESNLLAYMVRDPRFVRIAKGTYSLGSGPARPSPAKSKRKRRRRRRRAHVTSEV
jgi:hypothetical protein